MDLHLRFYSMKCDLHYFNNYQDTIYNHKNGYYLGSLDSKHRMNSIHRDSNLNYINTQLDLVMKESYLDTLFGDNKVFYLYHCIWCQVQSLLCFHSAAQNTDTRNSPNTVKMYVHKQYTNKYVLIIIWYKILSHIYDYNLFQILFQRILSCQIQTLTGIYTVRNCIMSHWYLYLELYSSSKHCYKSFNRPEVVLNIHNSSDQKL